MKLHNKLIKILSLIAVVAAVFFVSFIFYLETQNLALSRQTLPLRDSDGYLRSRQSPLRETLPEQEKTTNKQIQMLFFGDMMLDRHVGEKIEKYGLDYIFENFVASSSEIVLNDYNIVSCNLEGAVTNNGAHYNPVMSYDFAFAPELIDQLKNYNFNFFNLANNHFSDQGERGIIETRKNLDKLGFNYVGCRDGKVGECSSTVVEAADKKIGIAGFNMVYSKLNIAEAEKVINNLASTTDLVVVNMHWGNEYEHQFNKLQQEAAHSLIDASADIIIGHHPHVVQGIEEYKSKLIFYSLGNFVFDQYFSADTQEGLAVGVSVDGEQIEFFLYPLKSKLSQVELMIGEKKDEFLQKLVEWSEVEEEVAQQIKESKLQIKTLKSTNDIQIYK